MANLYIKVDADNKPINHPMFLSNLKTLFPKHDFDSGPPAGFLEFIRIPEPELGTYQKFDDSKGVENSDAFTHNGLEYKLIDGKISDYWNIKDMTAEEKQEKIDACQKRFKDTNGPASWVWNEEKANYFSPIPYPSDGKSYEWDESSVSWKEITE